MKDAAVKNEDSGLVMMQRVLQQATRTAPFLTLKYFLRLENHEETTIIYFKKLVIQKLLLIYTK